MTGTPPVVLLVDDEPDILGSIRLLLGRSKLGLRVLTAASGDEALDLLGRERVDLVLSDFKMPGMDGIQLLVRAREVQPEALRVLFTAYADAELERRSRAEAGLVAFWSKTLPSRELLENVEAVLADPGAGDPAPAPAPDGAA